MELREALAQIAEIRQQMSRGEIFRGYRSVPVAFAPWQMGLSFGGGHLLTAATLYWTLERQHDASIQ